MSGAFLTSQEKDDNLNNPVMPDSHDKDFIAAGKSLNSARQPTNYMSVNKTDSDQPDVETFQGTKGGYVFKSGARYVFRVL